MKYWTYPWILLLLFHQALMAQEKFEVSISFPDQIELNRVKIYYDAGKGLKLFKKAIDGPELTFSDDLFAARVVLEVAYPARAGEKPIKKNFLLAGGKKAVIKFKNAEVPLSLFELNNAKDLQKAGQGAYDRYMEPKLTEFQAFFSKNVSAINSGEEAATKEFAKKIQSLNEARLAFIRQNPQQFHSFIIFRQELLRSKLDPELLNKVYEDLFSEEIKRSWQGKNVARFLAGKMLKVGDQAPDFYAKDLQGKTLSGQDFKGKKPVLLIFWATWCKFCQAEMPDFKEIRAGYSEDQLLMIGVSHDVNENALKQGVAQHQLEWPQLFRQDQVSQIFAVSEVPSFILIDATGKILLKEMGLQKERIGELKAMLKKTL